MLVRIPVVVIFVHLMRGTVNDVRPGGQPSIYHGHIFASTQAKQSELSIRIAPYEHNVDCTIY